MKKKILFYVGAVVASSVTALIGIKIADKVGEKTKKELLDSGCEERVATRIADRTTLVTFTAVFAIGTAAIMSAAVDYNGKLAGRFFDDASYLYRVAEDNSLLSEALFKTIVDKSKTVGGLVDNLELANKMYDDFGGLLERNISGPHMDTVVNTLRERV